MGTSRSSWFLICSITIGVPISVIALTAHFHHRKLALDMRPCHRHVDDAVNGHQPIELVLDLLDHHWRADLGYRPYRALSPSQARARYAALPPSCRRRGEWAPADRAGS